MSSSLTNIGVVEPTVTISKGSTFAVAKFNSTFTPGTTVIAAATSGYATVQTNLITVAPVPYKLAVYGFPPVIHSDGTPNDAIVVQLQDSSSNPAKAPLEGITVILTSSNSTIASVAASAIISGGQTYTVASLTSNAVGSAIITAQASGYASAQTTITTKLASTTQPNTIKIYIAPPKTLADNTTHSLVVIQLLNATGAVTRAVTPITIQLSSSSETVGVVQSTLVIPTGWVYSTAMFTATYRGGTTTITAAATDLITDTETLTTIGPIPTQLSAYCNPSALQADGLAYNNTIQVQLQDATGQPALDPDGDVIVSLFSSDPTVGTVPATLTIPYGKTYATAAFTSEYITGTTSITAQASGYATDQAQMKTYLIENFSLTSVVTSNPTTVVAGHQTNITAYVTNQFGTPIEDATVKFNPITGGSFTTVNSLGNGYYTTMFTTPFYYSTTNITITATATRVNWANTTATTKLTVVPAIYYGTIQICARDEAEQPIGNATVYTLLEPSFMTNLTGTTNSSGYVTFANAGEGTYTFQVSKTGYIPMNITFAFNNNSAVQTVHLAAQPADLTWIIIILAIAIIVVVVIIIMWRFGLLAKIITRLTRNKQPPVDITTADESTDKSTASESTTDKSTN